MCSAVVCVYGSGKLLHRIYIQIVTPHVHSCSHKLRWSVTISRGATAFKFSAPAFGYNYWRLVVCAPLAEATSKHPCRLYGNIRKLRL